MNKRNFLKSIAALGGSALLPSSVNPLAMYKTASAAVNYSGATVVAPTVMPQVINIFLYGGPSELSGNLSNIVDINNNSQNPYNVNTAFGANIVNFDTLGDGSTGFITKNGFWRGNKRTDAPNTHLDSNGAGGRAMQYMLDKNHMSVYRTLMKRLDGTRSHRESLLQSFKGSLDIEGSPGVGTRIAATLFQHRALFENNTSLAGDGQFGDLVNDLLLPFVSFEGDTRAYQQDPDFQIPLLLRGLTLDENFQNPYSRCRADSNPCSPVSYDAVIEDLLLKTGVKISPEKYNALGYPDVENSSDLRTFLESEINGIQLANGADLPIIDPADPDAADDAASLGLGDPSLGVVRVAYPGNGNNYTARVRAAVTLALKNPGSLYITVGGGLGGWDDHNNGIDDYRNRMNDLMEVMKAAVLHIKYADASKNTGTFTTLKGNARPTDNIVMNICGDFGRRVNLNGNQGWDHGNNQNLFTFGGAGVRAPGAAALGKVVGKTVRVGDPGTNNQVTEPAQGSYEAEPMSVASTVFSYFGVQNPQVLTADDELNPLGVPAIDETQTAELPEPGIPSPIVP